MDGMGAERQTLRCLDQKPSASTSAETTCDLISSSVCLCLFVSDREREAQAALKQDKPKEEGQIERGMPAAAAGAEAAHGCTRNQKMIRQEGERDQTSDREKRKMPQQ